MTSVEISIVIPTRARDSTLTRCLSLLAPQLDDRVEVIVTDDGRSQRTRDLLARRFPFARWTAGPQRGPAANRNHGIELARGELLLLLDDDVEPGPTLIEAYRASLSDDVHAYEGRTTCQAGLRSARYHSPVNEHGGVLWSCNMMVRRSLFQRVGGFDEDFPYPHLEDVAFREQLRRLGEPIRFVPDAVVDHPPRRVPPARVLARYHEAYHIYHYKYLGRPPSLRRFLTTLVSVRVRTVLQHRLGADSLTSLGAASLETLLALAHWKDWTRRWGTTRAEVKLRDPF